jgi:hypothetical protein
MSDGRQPEADPVAAIYKAETFRSQLDTVFQVERDASLVPLRLTDVADGRTGGGFQRFSVLFHGPAEHVLLQGTYTFHHDALGTFPLFIVPLLESNTERIVYEACFSRPLPTADEP